MKQLVTFDAGQRAYVFDIGDSLTAGLHEGDVGHTLELVKAIDWLSDQAWFTIEHLKQLLDLTKRQARTNVWQMAAE